MLCIYIYTDILKQKYCSNHSSKRPKRHEGQDSQGNHNNLHQFATKLSRLSRLNPPPLASLNFTAGSWAFYCSIISILLKCRPWLCKRCGSKLTNAAFWSRVVVMGCVAGCVMGCSVFGVWASVCSERFPVQDFGFQVCIGHCLVGF